MTNSVSPQPFILDAGNAQIKSCTISGDSTNEDCFPHIMAPISEAEYNRISGRTSKPDGDYFIINGQAYVIGKKAARQGVFKRKHGATRYSPEYYGVFLAVAMARLTPSLVSKKSRKIFLVGSHAPQDADYADKLLSAACREWNVTWMGNDYLFDVVDGVTIDEPLGGWANTVLAKSGRTYSDRSVQDGTSLVIDIGAYTTDGIVIDPGGAIDYSTANSAVLGVLDAVEQFKKDFKSQHSDILQEVRVLDDDMVHLAMRTGELNLRGLGRFPCQELADGICNSLVADIYNFYSRYGGAANYDNLILTGGGSALLEGYLRSAISHNSIRMADSDSIKLHMANARGALKWYRMHEALGTFAS